MPQTTPARVTIYAAWLVKKASIVEPIDPFEGGELDGFKGSPRALPMDDLGLVEAVDGLSQGVDAPIDVKSVLVSGWSVVAACTGSRRFHGRRSV